MTKIMQSEYQEKCYCNPILRQSVLTRENCCEFCKTHCTQVCCMQYKDSLVILCQVCISQDTEQSINKSNDDHNSLFKALSIVKKYVSIGSVTFLCMIRSGRRLVCHNFIKGQEGKLIQLEQIVCLAICILLQFRFNIWKF